MISIKPRLRRGYFIKPLENAGGIKRTIEQTRKTAENARTLLAVFWYGLNVILQSYFHPNSLNNPNVRAALHKKYSANIEVVLPEKLAEGPYFIIAGPYLVEPMKDTDIDYMGGLAKGFIALSHKISLLKRKRENPLLVITREREKIALPEGLESVLDSTLPTKDSKKGRKVFANEGVKRRMRAHFKNDGCVAVFPAGKTDQYGMLKDVVPLTVFGIYQNNADFHNKKLGLAYAAFISGYENSGIEINKIEVGIIDLPKIYFEGESKKNQKEHTMRVAELVTQYSLAKIAQHLTDKKQRGEYQNPELEISRIAKELSDPGQQGVIVKGGFLNFLT